MVLRQYTRGKGTDGGNRSSLDAQNTEPIGLL